jgi:uncharacterized protein (DUF58 family)
MRPPSAQAIPIRWLQALTTPLGRATAVATAGTWLLGWRLGWEELFLAAAACLLTLAIATLFTLGRPLLRIEAKVEPTRVTVGDPAVGGVVVENAAGRRLLPLRVELPVGAATALLEIPALASGQRHEEVLVVPTNRRAVIPVGPASAVRGDPLGLLRREAASAELTELYVHPRIVPLSTFGAGLLRDLEGQPTPDTSTSDLAFHTLRDYVPGDDRRFVHWPSSAKAGRLLVRQFLDTRRPRLTVVLDSAAASYRDADQFETAVSVVGSIAVRAARDDREVTVVAGGRACTGDMAARILDTLSRAELGDDAMTLTAASAQTVRMAPDTTVAMLVTGSVVPFSDLRSAAARFWPDVRVCAVRVEEAAPSGVSQSGGITVLGLRQLQDLPSLLAGGPAG